MCKSPSSEAKRHRLPDTRSGVNHKFTIFGLGETEGNEPALPKTYKYYVTVNCYEDGQVGEIFVRADKEGSSRGSLLDAWCTMVSIALQSGITLRTITEKFKNWSFEPSGQTNNPAVRFCKSPLDYLCKWLEYKFLPDEESNP
jgi:ribonucleoside-diphosphate reductase alpha chain